MLNLYDTRIRVVFVVILSFIASFVSGQEWQHVVDFFPIPGRPITVWSLETFDDNDDYIYFSGLFMGLVNNTDTVYLQSLGKWDGQQFSSISGVTLSEQDVGFFHTMNAISIIDNTIYLRKVHPTFEWPIIENQTIISPLAKLTLEGWIDLDSGFDRTSDFFKLENQIIVFEYNINSNNTLNYETIGANNTEVGFYDESTHAVFEDYLGGSVVTSCFWNGYTYMAGQFNSIYGKIMRVSENGESDYLGSQITNNNSINAMVVYEDYLVVGGYFTVTDQQGNLIHNVAKWDGEQWHSLFGLGVNGGVAYLKIIDGILYITGNFSYVYLENELYPASKIVAYNGVDIYRLSDEIFDLSSSVKDVAVFQNSLYVSGNFSNIQNKSIAGIARLDTPVSLISPNLFFNSKTNSLKCYPNPANGFTWLSIQNENLKGTIEVIDSKGRSVKQVSVLNSIEYQLTLHGVESGVYFIRYSNDKQIQTIKLVVN